MSIRKIEKLFGKMMKIKFANKNILYLINVISIISFNRNLRRDGHKIMIVGEK